MSSISTTISRALKDRIVVLSLLVALICLLWSLMLFLAGVGRHGLSKRYHVSSSTGEAVITTAETYPAWLNETFLLADLWRNWDPEIRPFPRERPQYRVELSGKLTVPQSEAPAKGAGLFKIIYNGKNFEGKPLRAEPSETIQFSQLERMELRHYGDVSVEWIGQVRVNQPGEYQFSLISDDGSWLYLDGNEIIENGGAHMLQERSGHIFLDSGQHSIRVRYFDSGGGAELSLYWTRPDGFRESIPKEFLTYSNTGQFALEANCNCDQTVQVTGAERRGPRILEYLPSGTQDLTISLARAGEFLSATLRLRHPNGRYQPISPKSFLLPEEMRFGNRLFVLSALGLLAAVPLLVVLFLTMRGRDPRLNLSSDQLAFPLLVAITVLGFSLRALDYDYIPRVTDTQDEFNTAWIGFNMITEGLPRGWAIPGGSLEVKNEFWLGHYFALTDYVFHPPFLYGLLSGMSAKLAGAKTMFDLEISAIRIPSLLLSTLTVSLIFVFSKTRFGLQAAVLSSMLFATLPPAVILGRLNKEEIPLGLMALLLLWILARFFEAKGGAPPGKLLLLVALGPLVKEIGVFLGATAVLSCVSERRYRGAFGVFVATALGVACYAAYGIQLNAEQFFHVMSFHSGMVNRLTYLNELFYDWRIWNFPIGGWLLWLWLAAATCLRRKDRLIWYAIVGYLLAFFLIAPGAVDWAWYRIPLIPLLSILGGIFLERISVRPQLWQYLLFVLPIFSTMFQLLLSMTPTNVIPSEMARPLAFLIILIIGIVSLLPQRWMRMASSTSIWLFFVLNLFIVSDLRRLFTGGL